ncbi:molybdopterin-guanine dinucleotide biosynthesis protein B [Alicyclobacillus sp.]|uniref:molybdopterin-guanine dinucleotide biosynthesis protein B n=1 Tax=Alicyclobacillus sp. TaxID=61169 RepID=UPI0025BD3045|nr:molybdopterin-guanine dinucleotide biosynthesis protein B [Alicyclobacillus sp.]MCL6517914.1 molybdopterin-guanine dinucleotide biosynthesis protein B [Alicyclobacillus sp.]
MPDREGVGRPRALGVVGLQNSGKTRLMRRMIEHFAVDGLLVAAIKHDAHAADGDDWEKPGSDTALFASAGAVATVVAGGGQSLWRWRDDASAEDARALVERMARWGAMRGGMDLILVEGFKHSPLPKVAVVRTRDHLAWLESAGLSQIRAVVGPADAPWLAGARWPVYDEDDVPGLCRDVWTRWSVPVDRMV